MKERHETENKTCQTCDYYHQVYFICENDKSEYYTNQINKNRTCEYWKLDKNVKNLNVLGEPLASGKQNSAQPIMVREYCHCCGVHCPSCDEPYARHGVPKVCHECGQRLIKRKG